MSFIQKSKEQHHIFADYLLLFAMLGSFLICFLLFRSDMLARRILSVLMGVAYFGWGLYHHEHTHRVTFRIVLEYFFVGLFATSILFILTL